MLTFSADPALIVALLVSTILPVLVGLVTTRVTAGGVKAALLAALALVTSLLTELGRAIEAGVSYDVGQGLLLALPVFVVSVALHYGLWKPAGVSAAVQSVGRHADTTRPTDGLATLDRVALAEIAAALDEGDPAREALVRLGITPAGIVPTSVDPD